MLSLAPGNEQPATLAAADLDRASEFWAEALALSRTTAKAMRTLRCSSTTPRRCAWWW